MYANTNAVPCIWRRKDPLGTVGSINGRLRNESHVIFSFNGLDGFLRIVGSRQGGKAQECEEKYFHDSGGRGVTAIQIVGGFP